MKYDRKGVSDINLEVFNLHTHIFWLGVLAGIVIFSLMAEAIIFHRKSFGYKAATFHENIDIEIIWILIPFLILLSMSILSIRV